MKSSLDYNWHVNQYEQFHCMGHTWNVQEAKQILASKAHGVRTIDVDAWFQTLPPYAADIPAFNEKGQRVIRLGISINSVDAEKADLDFPLIVAQVDVKNEFMPIIIDGYHRLWKAKQKGITKLLAVLLSKEDSAKIKF